MIRVKTKYDCKHKYVFVTMRSADEKGAVVTGYGGDMFLTRCYAAQGTEGGGGACSRLQLHQERRQSKKLVALKVVIVYGHARTLRNNAVEVVPGFL